MYDRDIQGPTEGSDSCDACCSPVLRRVQMLPFFLFLSDDSVSLDFNNGGTEWVLKIIIDSSPDIAGYCSIA